MSYNPDRLPSILVLTEDSGGDAYETVHALAKEMLKLLVPGVQTHRISFSPLEDKQARQAMHANLWKSKNPLDERARRLLVRTIINKLLDEEYPFTRWDRGSVPWRVKPRQAPLPLGEGQGEGPSVPTVVHTVQGACVCPRGGRATRPRDHRQALTPRPLPEGEGACATRGERIPRAHPGPGRRAAL